MVGKTHNTADVIIIGGGVAGLSTAIELAQRGSQVIVLERERLGNGSTGRGAGLLGQLRGTPQATRMLMHSVELMKELERRADVKVFTQTGSLRIAETPSRAQEISELVQMGKAINLEVDHISKREVAEKLPYMQTDDLIDACFCPSDGCMNPPELANAYIKVGKSLGVQYITNCPVVQVMIPGGKAKGVQTARGDLYAPVIVNAAGPWSYLIADLAQTKLPAAAIGHCYLTTQPDDDHPVDPLSPSVRDRHLSIYSRPKDGGLLVGMYDQQAVQYDMEELPSDFDMSAMRAGTDDIRVARLIRAAQRRFPWIDEHTPMTITTGIMTFTPDGYPFCGTMPHIEGLYHCSGFCGHGISQSPTIGVIMAELILTGRTDYDIQAIQADRFFDVPGFGERAEIKAKCYKMHASYYGQVQGKSAASSH